VINVDTFHFLLRTLSVGRRGFLSLMFILQNSYSAGFFSPNDLSLYSIDCVVCYLESDVQNSARVSEQKDFVYCS